MVMRNKVYIKALSGCQMENSRLFRMFLKCVQ